MLEINQTLGMLTFQRGVLVIILGKSYLCVLLLTPSAQRQEYPWLVWNACCESQHYLSINTWTVAPELHASLHSGSVTCLFHVSCRAGVFLTSLLKCLFPLHTLKYNQCHFTAHFWSRRMLCLVCVSADWCHERKGYSVKNVKACRVHYRI